jgi:hypothetical protein
MSGAIMEITKGYDTPEQVITECLLKYKLPYIKKMRSSLQKLGLFNKKLNLPDKASTVRIRTGLARDTKITYVYFCVPNFPLKLKDFIFQMYLTKGQE